MTVIARSAVEPLTLTVKPWARTSKAEKNYLAREPQRIPNRLEHRPLMVGSQDTIPL